jgi:hypothetical protein
VIMHPKSQDSSVSIVTRLRAGRPKNRHSIRSKVIVSSRLSTGSGPTHPHFHWLPGRRASGMRRLEREADHLPTSIADVKNAWSST